MPFAQDLLRHWLAGEWGKQSTTARWRVFESEHPFKRCTPETVADSIVGFITAHGVVTGQHLVLDAGTCSKSESE